MKTILFLASICLANTFKAQSTGDFRSAASGNWSTAATWEKFDGTTWAAASTAPALADGTITVVTGHTVAMDATMSIDSLFVQTGGTLSVNTGLIVTVPVNTVAALPATGIKVTGTMNVNGKIVNQGIVGLGTGGLINWNGGSEYQHDQALGSIPVSTWNTNSLCNVTGATGASPSNMNQNFNNLTWNCTGQTTAFNWGWNGNNVTGLIKIISMGSAPNLRMSASTATPATPVVLNVNNIEVQSGIFTTTGSGGAQVYVLNINGNLTVNGSGVFNVSNGSGGDVTINIKGDVNLNSSTVSCYIGGSPTTGTARYRKTVFAKNGTQVFTKAALNTISTNQQFEVANGAMLDLNNSSIASGTSGTLGPFATFTVQDGGGITTSAPGGFNDNFSSATQRLFLSPLGNYGFSGTALQSTGTKLQNDSVGVSAIIQSPTNGFKMTCNNLIVNNTGANADNILTLSKQFVVNGSLVLTDGLVLPSSTNSLTLTETASITGGSVDSYVAKELTRLTNSTATYLFPIGKGTSYRPCWVTPSAATSSSYYAEYYNLGYLDQVTFTAPVTSVSSTEYWNIAKTLGASAKISLPLNGAVTGGNATNQVGIVHFTSAAWKVEGGIGAQGDATTGTLSSDFITSFSPFTFGIVPSGTLLGLPVTLLNFNANYTGTSVKLNWNTANEINVKNYIIQRSTDGINFINIGVVHAIGNSYSNTYSYIDATFNGDKLYYRLQSVDLNGTYKNSTIIIINTKLKNQLQVFPNPTTDFITIVTLKSSKQTIFNIISNDGKLVKQLTIEPNTIQSSMYIRDLPAGNYILLNTNTKNSIGFIKL